MNKSQYRYNRALIRSNGYYALRWMSENEANIFVVLRDQKLDNILEKIWCMKNGFTIKQSILMSKEA